MSETQTHTKSRPATRFTAVEIRMRKIRRRFDATKIDDIPATVRSELSAGGVTFAPGEKIAIGCGSRGIANLPEIVATLVEEIRRAGADPFIIPVMGSHGGGTAAGQAQFLADYGITESAVGAPVRSSMDTVELPSDGLPHGLFMDRLAFESDGVVLVNRVKPHTDFHAAIESGIMKMSIIGLGKHDQANTMHSFGVRGLKELLVPAARKILQTGKIRAGIALVENAYDETMVIRALGPEIVEAEEMKLLDVARAAMPQLPLDSIDILVIDRMGKDISGVGMDPNIIGRMRIAGQDEPDSPWVTRIVCTDLTPASHGNALGVGLADLITDRLYRKIDFEAMNANLFTSTFLERGKIPPVASDAEQAVAYALRTCAKPDPRAASVVRVRDTLHIGDLWVSENAIDEVMKRDDVELLDRSEPLIGSDGELTPF
ncbi:MAG: DUF2088 domain-containing protein [Spirochaetaceae bacterium]|nr:MAG: DUF2088 domain-containing protein [Spirochaetaceae bacterium]